MGDTCWIIIAWRYYSKVLRVDSVPFLDREMRKCRHGPTYNSSLFSVKGSKPAIDQVLKPSKDDGPPILPMYSRSKTHCYHFRKTKLPFSSASTGHFTLEHMKRYGKHNSSHEILMLYLD